ncbi:MAG TPA: DNA mismatch repair endonuclease MutL [Pyrinomonadaceae bacterium]|jgi:DNA mismatch repair protein MutL|nr:DNA mismatch repair endonuclease MutL [Pyrinomonadaceae bacterium]
MSKIRVLADHVANQIAAGEVVERPASVAKELVENSIDAGASRIAIEIEAGGRRLLKVSDDGEGMVRDDAVLAFERHATSKISVTDDLAAIATLGFRGEALASIASVARVELVTSTEEASAATKVVIEGGRMRDVKDAAHPRGTTISVKDLFFNVPARRKFLRSEATETFHLTNLVTHYALAHPEIGFTFTNNGREVIRASAVKDLRERAYQVFGEEFLENLLEVSGGHPQVVRVQGYISAPRDRRTSRDSQYLFVNRRFVRDRMIGRALSEGYRSILPHGVYPAALLFIETPLEEVDVNVHPAKTEVRFRRSAAVADAVRDAVRSALAAAGYVRDEREAARPTLEIQTQAVSAAANSNTVSTPDPIPVTVPVFEPPPVPQEQQQSRMEFVALMESVEEALDEKEEPGEEMVPHQPAELIDEPVAVTSAVKLPKTSLLPPLNSAEKFAREVTPESLTANIRPLGQLEESFIIATDDEGLLLIDQHVAHERVLFDKYRALEAERRTESQQLLVPETFDLTPAQAAVFDQLAPELEKYGFDLMRLSGRTVAIKATPADLPVGEARNMLFELLDTVDAEKKGSARETLRDEIAASLACHAAIKVNMPLAPEKMRWLIDRLLQTSSPTTCPHGRPVILRLKTRDILKGFHRI